MLNREKAKRKCISLNEFIFVCFLLSILSPLSAFTQDKIYKTDGSVIETKVQEVGAAEIKYKKFSNQSGPTYIINKNEIIRIVYENGEKEEYNPGQTDQPAIYQTPVVTPMPVYRTRDGNDDMIITYQGDSIRCIIDLAGSSTIAYHIKKQGIDPKKEIAITEVLKYANKGVWFDSNGVGSSADMARNFILSEKINEAIAAYAQLIAKDSTNATLFAEDAYALALGGVYEAALMRLDHSWALGVNSPDIPYFTSQVFALMGYDDLANAYWTTSGTYKTPGWITSKSSVLLRKFKDKSAKTAKINREQLIANFKRANLLASQKSWFQSIALFHRITDRFPNEYLPYVGYSIALENTGAFEKSVQIIEKAITLTGKNQEDLQKKQFLEERLASVKRKQATVTNGELPGFSPKKLPDRFRPQTMIYAGGMAGPSMISVNGRFGRFTSGSTTTSADFSFNNTSGFRYLNLGISTYIRYRSLVSGFGFLLGAGDAKPTYSIKISVGVSVINKTQTSSFDVFLDVNAGLIKGSLTTYGLSIGKTLYFGKRK